VQPWELKQRVTEFSDGGPIDAERSRLDEVISRLAQEHRTYRPVRIANHVARQRWGADLNEVYDLTKMRPEGAGLLHPAPCYGEWFVVEKVDGDGIHVRFEESERGTTRFCYRN